MKSTRNTDNTIEQAKSYALKVMLYKERTAHELTVKLEEKGFDSDIAQEVTQHFVSLGYVDNRLYAEKYIKDAVNLKGWGRHRIQHELLLRGVDRETVEQELEQFNFDDCRLVEMLQKKIDRTGTDDKNIIKLKNHFIRKGHSADKIDDALREILSFTD